MKLRVRRVRLEADAADQRFVADVAFGPHVTVLRADNSAGKSTLVMSILYGLGLEGALTPRHAPPFAHALTQWLSWSGLRVAIGASRVWLEFEGISERLVCRRAIVGEDTHLIQVWRGSAINALGDQRQDYFVRMPGSAQRDLGFHTFLAQVTGAELPVVPRHDGSETRLYFECLVPQVFVEQKQGWGTIHGKYPTWLSVRDMHTRVLEFLLRLDRVDLASRRERLRAELVSVAQIWKSAIEAFRVEAAREGYLIEGASSDPVPDARLVAIAVTRSVVEAGQSAPVRESLADHLTKLRSRVAELRAVHIPATSEIVQSLEAELASLNHARSEYSARAVAVARDLHEEREEARAIDAKISSLNGDLERYKDVARLQRLGSTMNLTLARNTCPTCAQPVSGVLLEHIPAMGVMTVEQSSEYLRDQLRLYQIIASQTRAHVSALEEQELVLERELRELRSRIRTVETTLVTDSRAPSRAMIEETVRKEAEIRAGERLAVQRADLLSLLGSLAERYALLLAERREVESIGNTERDRSIVAALSRRLHDYAGAFGVQDVQIEGLQVSDSLEPYNDRQQGELQFELSASDAIRAAWAFRMAVLETASEFNGNHPGFLVLDEPRQQSARLSSLIALIDAAADISHRWDVQVVLATSEEDVDAMKTTHRPDVVWQIMPVGYLLRPDSRESENIAGPERE